MKTERRRKDGSGKQKKWMAREAACGRPCLKGYRMREKRRRFPRWIAALLVTVLVMASLAGCAGGNAEGTDRGTAAGYAAQQTTAHGADVPGEAAEPALQMAEEAAQQEESERPEEAAEPAQQTAEEPQQEPEAPEKTELSVTEDGTYTSKEEVALYLHLYGKLPSNYITKKEAEELGWKKQDGEAGQLHVAAPGKSIGGSYFGNYEGLLPEKKGRKYYECDINYVSGNRGAERIIYSNDGLIYYTGDHYKTFELLYGGDGKEEQ